MRVSKPMGTAEFELTIEEEKRLCVPSFIGFGIDDKNVRHPALYVKTDLKDRAAYINKDVESVWSIAQDHGIVRAVFLYFELKATGINLRVCFDGFTTEFIEWLELLIKMRGELALTDNPDPEAGGISITGIPLDAPLLLVNSLKIKKKG